MYVCSFACISFWRLSLLFITCISFEKTKSDYITFTLLLHFRYDITLELSEAIFGSEKEFDLTHLETCEACAGTGAKAGSKMRICFTCGGRGQVMRTEQTPFGMFSQVLAVDFFPSCLLSLCCNLFESDDRNGI